MSAHQDQSHQLDGLSASVAVFLRALDPIRRTIAIDAGLNGNELRSMGRIAEAQVLTPKILAELLGLSTATVTAITSGLVRKRLIERTEHPTDRRSLLLQLTPGGHRLMNQTYTRFSATINAAGTKLDPGDSLILEQLLGDLSIALTDADLALL